MENFCKFIDRLLAKYATDTFFENDPVKPIDTTDSSLSFKPQPSTQPGSEPTNTFFGNDPVKPIDGFPSGSSLSFKPQSSTQSNQAKSSTKDVEEIKSLGNELNQMSLNLESSIDALSDSLPGNKPQIINNIKRTLARIDIISQKLSDKARKAVRFFVNFPQTKFVNGIMDKTKKQLNELSKRTKDINDQTILDDAMRIFKQLLDTTIMIDFSTK